MTGEAISAELRARFLASGDAAALPIVDPHRHVFGRNHHLWLDRAAVADRPVTERLALFHDNAARWYLQAGSSREVAP